MGKRKNMLILLILFTLLICMCMRSVSTSAPSKINESSSRQRSEPNVLGPSNRGSTAAVTDASDIQTNLPNGEDPDPVTQRRRNKIREMTTHAWTNYKKYAWGQNELRPVSKTSNGGPFGGAELGATIIDSLDTLYMMGLKEQYLEGREWVAQSFTLRNKNCDLSVFEVVIRFVGGLLTMFAFTGDVLYKNKAQEVADKLLPAFQTPTGIPRAIINTAGGYSKNHPWTTGTSVLAEIGTLHLEFAYLSDITGNPIYRNRVLNVRKYLDNAQKPNGLYPNYISPDSGTWGQQQISLGAMGDSFYEYLLKVWIQSNKTDSVARRMYDDAMAAIVNNLIQTSRTGLIYTSDMRYNSLDHTMDHLACFSGGLFALGAATKNTSNSARYMEIGEGITNTCHESYIRTPTHLGPEKFGFNQDVEAKSFDYHSKYYILRPETIESYFVLWRLTHDQKYRDWAWDAAQAIDRHCRTEGGFSGIHNVYSEHPHQNDAQESFFIAEVLKYLYLIFSDDSLLPLDEWVFNTEAHPLPVKGTPMYRQTQRQRHRLRSDRNTLQ